MSAIMTSRQASELDFAFERNGFSAADVKKMSEGNLLAQILMVVRGRAEVVVKSILEPVANFTVGAQERFVASEKFVENTSDETEVKIAYVWDGFRDHFLDKIEGATTWMNFATHTLTEASLDEPILAELGEKAETTLSQFYALLKAQGRGEPGVLLTNGYANIFYIRDAEGTLWAVDTDWYAGDDGWYVNADSVTDPSEWSAGYQVVSRN